MIRKLHVVFLAMVVLVGMTTAVEAYSPVFPIGPEWSASYFAGDSASSPNFWDATLAATSNFYEFNTLTYYEIIQSNWDNDSVSKTRYLASSATALYMSKTSNEGGVPVFQTGDDGFSWSYTQPGETEATTATILSKNWGYTVSGTYYEDAYLVSNVIGSNPVWYEVYLPGVGLLGDLDYWADNLPVYHVLSGYTVDMPAVPVPPSLVLLASGLICLGGWRKWSLRK